METIPPPETVYAASARVSCDGDVAGDLWGVAGHPRVFLQIDARGFADCGYCDRRFVLAGGPADPREGIAPPVDDHH